VVSSALPMVPTGQKDEWSLDSALLRRHMQ